MKSTTALVARQYRLNEWAEMIRQCNSRPSNLSVKDWCSQHQITTADYYYRLKQVRTVCLESMPVQSNEQSVISVPTELINTVSDQNSALQITINNATIHVTEDTSKELLKMVLQVISHAE